ncbi:MAG: hypothetical protein N2322_03095, partial [Terrimicrobiaceae bacterium]|nr:hypothetical protein [Terrimicrobiaceae bacterium]
MSGQAGWKWVWTLLGGLALAAAAWVVWAPLPLSSQEAAANAAKAADFFAGWLGGGGVGWWSPNFLGGTSLAPLWGTFFTSAWLQLWVAAFGAGAGAKLAMLACVPLAALAMRGFVKALSGCELAAALAGLAYASAPGLWMRIMGFEHVVVVCALAVLPLVCWSVLRLVERPTAWSALACAAAFSALALTYSKAALVALPGLGLFGLWGLWKHCGLAAWLRPRVGGVLVAGVLLLGVLPNLPALRESGFAALFEFGPLEGWKQSFSSKSAIHFLDRLGVVSAGFRGDFAPTTAAGGYFPGVAPLLFLALAVVLWPRVVERAREFETPLRLSLGLGLFMFWLSHGPFSVLSGTLRALEASAEAPDFLPAMMWGALMAQGWLIWRLFPPAMPLRKSCAILLMAVYFLVPGFGLLEWLPFYYDLRAPFDFFQVGGLVWVCTAAGLGAAALDRMVAGRLLRLGVIAVVAGLWAGDFAGNLGLAGRKGLGAAAAADFEEAARAMREARAPGGFFALSGRYFYLRLPELTGRPLLNEAFQSYLQQRGYAALSTAAFSSEAEFCEFLRLAGARFVFLDIHDPDFPKQFAEGLRERLPTAYANANFEILEVPASLAPAFSARDVLLLASEEPADIAASLGAAAADFAAIGPFAPGESAGTITDGAMSFDPGFKARRGEPFEPIAHVRRPAAGRIEIEAPRGWVIVPEAWHPDWKAGGEKASKAFGALLAAWSEGGPVVFEFQQPWWYGAAMSSSGLAWVAALGVLLLGRRRLDKESRPPPLGIARPPVSRPLVVCPTYNEAESLPAVLEKIFSAAPAVHVLIVDDASPD